MRKSLAAVLFTVAAVAQEPSPKPLPDSANGYFPDMRRIMQSTKPVASKYFALSGPPAPKTCSVRLLEVRPASEGDILVSPHPRHHSIVVITPPPSADPMPRVEPPAPPAISKAYARS